MKTEATVIVPSSSANLSVGFDTLSLALAKPFLQATFSQRSTGTISLEALTNGRAAQPPEGQTLGYSARQALQVFLAHYRKSQGGHLLLEDQGYSAGGLGRSGAEAVGAIIAAAVVHDIHLTRDEVIHWAGLGEPGKDLEVQKPGHLDNVAASTNGGLNVVAFDPRTEDPDTSFYTVPDNLGIAIGVTPYEKAGGTEAMRDAITEPVPSSQHVQELQSGLAAIAALVSSEPDIGRFLRHIGELSFHEMARADIKGYGPFDSSQLAVLKSSLYDSLGVATTMSGAGPKFLFMYDKTKVPDDLEKQLGRSARTWARDCDPEFSIEIISTEVARHGAFEIARLNYGWGKE